MGPETLISFFAASLMLALAPGPDNIFVLTHSVLQGRQAGLAVVMGLCTGLLVHTTLVALGLAAIIQSTGWALAVLKIFGAAYLLYLAWRAITARPLSLDEASAFKPSFVWSYRRGVIMNISNPKVLLFFLAFLPQFVSPQADNMTQQILLLGGFFIVATILVFGAMALMAGQLSTLFRRSPQLQCNLNKLAALVFIALALHLLLSDFA